MATVSFYGGLSSIANLSGSGVGFYGNDGFGAAVGVGEFNYHTYITNSAGTAQGAEIWNIQYLNSQSGIIGQTGSGVHLKAIPNYQATLNIRFTHSTAVKLQNSKVRIFDRNSTNSPASGITCRLAQIVHPWLTQSPLGSGDSEWQGITTNPLTGSATLGGSGLIATLSGSPGISGFSPSGTNTYDIQHDYYVAISCSPDTIGSKTFGLSFSTEYL
mgnify:CR=1 FL=1